MRYAKRRRSKNELCNHQRQYAIQPALGAIPLPAFR